MSLLDAYIYIKFLWGQGNNHIGVAMNIVQNLMIGGMFLKMFNLSRFVGSQRVYRCVVFSLGVVYVLGVIFAGFLVVKFNVVDKENTLNQTYNHEIQTLLNQTK